MLTSFQTVSCFILSCRNCVHWPKMSQNVWPLCFSHWAVRSRNVLHWLLCAVFYESVIYIGTGVSLSNSSSAISFYNIERFMGASMSTIGVALIVYCSKIDLASWAVSKFACQVMTISSQKTGLMIMSPVCTDSVMTTVALFCSSFLIYFLYFVPTYYMYFPCWCTYDLLQPCVHNRTHFFSGYWTTLSSMHWWWLHLCNYVRVCGYWACHVHRILVLLL